MGVAGQTFAVHFLAEIQQLLFGQTPFQIRTCVHAGRHMPLYVEQIAAMVFVFGVPEMVKACAEHVRQRSE